MINIYTDGACSGNPGPGGWAAVLIGTTKTIEIGGREDMTTNNRMELKAAIEGLKMSHGHTCTVFTDSEYVQKGITCWISGWKSKGWRKSDGKPVVNQDLWVELDTLNTEKVSWEWVRGHDGNEYNERCDVIATSFSKNFSVTLNGVHQSTGKTTIPTQSTVCTEPFEEVTEIPQQGRSHDYPCYISLVHGVLEYHTDWASCHAATNGKSSLLKKVKNQAEEETLLASWKTMKKLF